jgi:hypothetical protein
LQTNLRSYGRLFIHETSATAVSSLTMRPLIYTNIIKLKSLLMRLARSNKRLKLFEKFEKKVRFEKFFQCWIAYLSRKAMVEKYFNNKIAPVRSRGGSLVYYKSEVI